MTRRPFPLTPARLGHVWKAWNCSPDTHIYIFNSNSKRKGIKAKKKKQFRSVAIWLLCIHYTHLYTIQRRVRKLSKKKGWKRQLYSLNNILAELKKNAISEKGDRTLLNRFSMCSSHNVTRIKRERRIFFSVSGNLRKND